MAMTYQWEITFLIGSTFYKEVVSTFQREDAKKLILTRYPKAQVTNIKKVS